MHTHSIQPRKRHWGPFGLLISIALVITTVLLPVAPVFASESEGTEGVSQSEVQEPDEVRAPETEETPPVTNDQVDTKPQAVESADLSEVTETAETAEVTVPDSMEEPQENEFDTSDDDPAASIEDEPKPNNPDMGTSSEALPVADEATSTETYIPDVNTATATIDIPEEDMASTSTQDAATTSPLGETGEDEQNLTAEDLTEDKDIALNEYESTVEEETAVPAVSKELEEPFMSSVNNENRYRFSQDECITVGDGSFYCSKAEAHAESVGMDRVFAASDEDEGDREIYIEVDGELTQITKNSADDDAPYYDKISETIVWHRLIDGRYQIMEYDLSEKTERQLTNERYNNMQPMREGDITLWQGWVGSDWEIMIEEDGEYAMLTDNTIHDIDPHINGDYIIWQSFENGLWQVKVYDSRTDELRTVGSSEGGSAQNPRFVLVYDTKLENGDIETKGYDLESGELVPLSATPAPSPKDIPDPDPTDEDRALVQQVIQLKPKSESETDDDLGDDIGIATSTAVHGDDVVIPPYESATATEGLLFEEEMETIEDVIIPPFTESDSQ